MSAWMSFPDQTNFFLTGDRPCVSNRGQTLVFQIDEGGTVPVLMSPIASGIH